MSTLRKFVSSSKELARRTSQPFSLQQIKTKMEWYRSTSIFMQAWNRTQGSLNLINLIESLTLIISLCCRLGLEELLLCLLIRPESISMSRYQSYRLLKFTFGALRRLTVDAFHVWAKSLRNLLKWTTQALNPNSLLKMTPLNTFVVFLTLVVPRQRSPSTPLLAKQS
jgi:hypothetical protein